MKLNDPNSFDTAHQNGGIALNVASMVSTSDGVVATSFRGGEEHQLVEDGDCMLIDENNDRTASK